MSASRSSSASRSPVEAPDGTAARPNAPPSSVTSTSTVGLPRESRISRACMRVILNPAPRESTLSTPAATIGFRFEPERLFAERSDQRLVVGRHDDHARVGHGVTPAIFLFVVADERTARDEDVAVDDRPLDARVAADAHAGHQDAALDLAEAVD